MKKLFPGQQENEQIHLVIRQHWSIFARHVLAWSIFVVILLGGHIVLTRYFPEILEPPYIHILRLGETVYMMFLLQALLILWVLYYLNVQIVTSERVVDIEQKGLLHHTISELSLNRIQDVTAEVHGFLETFLDYGNVHLQTAGETERFIFQRVGNPTKVSAMILDLYDQLSPEEKAKGK